jgi:bisphosphoglycerate-dependent phosphoglycerate mutase
MMTPLRSRALHLALIDKSGMILRVQRNCGYRGNSFRCVHSSTLGDKEEKHQQRKFTTINEQTPYNICFLRHGQSTWNRDNRFIGWTDTPLTDDGVLEARVAGQMLSNAGILFDEVHTSLLRRSIRTVNLTLMEMGQEYIPVHKHWRLNERSYGDLVGKNKKETVKFHGKDQVKRWRRSYDEPPPPMSPDHEFHPASDPRYRHVSCSCQTRLCSLPEACFLIFSSHLSIIMSLDARKDPCI